MQRDLQVEGDGDSGIRIRFSGPWYLRDGLPSIDTFQESLAQRSNTRTVVFDTEGVTGWDSSIVTFARQVGAVCDERGVAVDFSGLPAGAIRLMELADAVPEKSDARSDDEKKPMLDRIGDAVLGGVDGGREALTFIGEMTLALGQFLRGAARYRRVDFGLMLQHSGADALPIITLISILVGLIFAFVGAVQLEQFGAAVYVADLVCIAMTREMGAMMTAIVMAGRTGAAFAAQLGSMKVNQEIDALRTMGISPLEYLVLPRMLALSLMMPLLWRSTPTVVGIIGGAVIGIGMLDDRAHHLRSSTRIECD